MDAENLKALATQEYWDKRYTQQQPNSVAAEVSSTSQVSSHEWFRSFEQLSLFFDRQLRKQLAKDGLILHLGCGDSTLPADLYQLGYENQICVDFSQVVIAQMRSRYQDMQIQWLEMDIRDLQFEDNHIDLAIDKGTLDAFIHGSPWDPPEDVLENVGRYVGNVARVLRPGGLWIYITYRQPHFMKPFLERNVWDIEVQQLNDNEEASFAYYAFIMKKRSTPETPAHSLDRHVYSEGMDCYATRQ